MSAKPKPVTKLRMPRLTPLEKGFVLSKPVQQDGYDQSVVYELEKQGKLIITRKRDGYKLFAAKAKGKWKIYTDGKNEVHCLDHIKLEFEKLAFGNGTLIVGEGVIDKYRDDCDNFSLVARIIQSNPEQGIELQRQNGLVKFMVFGTVLENGLLAVAVPYKAKLQMIQQMVSRLTHVIPVTVVELTYDEAQKLVRRERWEGLVLYASDFCYSYRLDGKDPERVKGCYKWKPIYEDDFIVTGFVPSEKNPGCVKEVLLAQVDPKTGKHFDCGKYGAFDKKTRGWLMTAKYPLVIQLEFEKRYPSGKLRNARIPQNRRDNPFRDDKKPTDCISAKSYVS